MSENIAPTLPVEKKTPVARHAKPPKKKPVDSTQSTRKTRDYEQKCFIVELLACHQTPSYVVKEVRQRFGVELTRQMIEVYDPTKISGRKLGQELRDIFFAERALFVKELEHIGISLTAYRLRMLQVGAEDFFERRNYLGMAALLEQAAKDVGGVFTNRRELTGKEGGDIGVTVKHEPYVTKEQYSKMTPEERVEARNAVEVLYRIALSEGGEPDE